MTTIINTPAKTESADSSAGWMFSILILLAVIGGGAYYWTNYRTPATSETEANINLTLPTSGNTNSGQ